MNVTIGHEERFATYLQKLSDDQDRAALAALRRGLGKRPGEATEMFRYVAPWLPGGSSGWHEDAYFAVAALFALHKVSWPPGEGAAARHNLGASFARLKAESRSPDSVEKRFVALLNCHREDLYEHLRHAVALLKTKEVPIDWACLLRDIRAWEREGRSVQRAWARAFWGSPDSGGPTPQNSEEE